MQNRHLPFVTASVAAAILVLSPGQAEAAAPECEDLTVDAMEELRAEIQNAYDTVPPASEQQFDAARLFLDDALDEADEMIGWMLITGDPSTTYAEAGTLGNWLMRISSKLWAGAHWSAIGAAVHGSTDARDAFELSLDAGETTTDLRRSAGRCYLGPYLP